MHTRAINIHSRYTLFSLAAVALFIGSYYYFLTYQPKVLVELREVKGMSTNSERELIPNLAYPLDTKQLSITKGSNSQQITFQSSKSPQEVQEFYSNIFLADNWRVKSQGAVDNFSTSYYKKDNTHIYIKTTLGEDGLTITSIDVQIEKS